MYADQLRADMNRGKPGRLLARGGPGGRVALGGDERQLVHCTRSRRPRWSVAGPGG